MRDRSIALAMIAMLIPGCSNQSQKNSSPVDTTLPANTQAIGGASDATESTEDLNAEANAAIADVNAAVDDAGIGVSGPDYQSSSLSSPPADAKPEDAQDQASQTANADAGSSTGSWDPQ